MTAKKAITVIATLLVLGLAVFVLGRIVTAQDGPCTPRRAEFSLTVEPRR